MREVEGSIPGPVNNTWNRKKKKAYTIKPAARESPTRKSIINNGNLHIKNQAYNCEKKRWKQNNTSKRKKHNMYSQARS